MDEREALTKCIDGQDLSRSEIESLFGRLMDGELSDIYKSALLVALAAKGESVEEITGAALAMRARVIPVPHRLDDVVDTCGTGGDGAGTFNISTAAAFVAAAGGVHIAKHGNRAVSSKSGSADVLESLGIPLQTDAEAMGRALETVGIAFLFAPALHPAMKEVMPVRRELGIRTVFNLLGPLTNPASASRQVLGVFAADRVEPMARVLLELGTEHALVVHGDDGLDELTTTDSTLVCEVRNGDVELHRIQPEDCDFERAALDDLRGGDAAENATMMRAVLSGAPGPLADITALNAGAAIYVGGVRDSLPAGVEKAREILASGAGWAKLEELKAFV